MVITLPNLKNIAIPHIVFSPHSFKLLPTTNCNFLELVIPLNYLIIISSITLLVQHNVIYSG